MSEFQKKCNSEVEESQCNGSKDKNTNTARRMKLFSCELIALLTSLNTVLALIGIILGSLAITQVQQNGVLTASSLQKVSSFRQKNSIAAEQQSQLTEEVIKIMIHNALIEMMSSGNYTGQPGNKCL